MDDLEASCKEKLGHFRIKELKDVLTQLGLSKQGKKQDLVGRILSALSEEQAFGKTSKNLEQVVSFDRHLGSKMWSKKNIGKEEVASFVDDIYRKMQVSGAMDLATKGQGTLETSSNVKMKGEFEDPFQPDTKVRCPCGSSLETDSMIMCEDSRCHIWQHMSCVVIPEKPMEGHLPIPEVFYCELCRLSRADPFWVSVAHPLNPVKLTISSIPADGTNPMQSVERNFQLTRADKDLLTKAEYDVQAWCMLLNDKVPFRMQWPQYTDLQINGVPVRAINRPGSQLLGANGRDDGPIITPYTKDGINKISVTGCDARIFCVGVRIVKKRTLQQILNLIPKEIDGERFEDALSRVCRCVGGGATEADSDSDIEVVADTFTVNLRCPMSGSRMKVAGRFKPCIHMGCFDLDVFVEMNQRSRKWQCPICLKNYSLENIIIDPYFNRITSMMRHCGEDVAEIDVKPEGSWRVKSKSESERRELGDLWQWHLPDGTLCVPTAEKLQPKAELLKQAKHEGGSEGPTGLKLRIRQDREGLWKVSKPPNGMNTSSGNSRLHDAFGDHEEKVIPMGSSATGSGRDGDDPSVNEDGGGHFDYNPGIELDSVPYNVGPSFGFPEQNPSTAPVGDAEVIVLSDSDEDNDVVITSTSGGYKGNNQENDPNGIGFSIDTSMADSFEDPVLVNGTSPCLGLFGPSGDEFGGMPLWPLPPGTQGGSSFQLFNPDGDVSDPLVDMSHGSMGYNNLVVPDSGMGPDVMLGDPSAGPSNSHLVDNPLAMGREDPSLKIFLPTRPSGVSVQSNMRDEADMSNGIHTEDYLSLSLGGHGDSAAGPNGFNSRQQQIPSQNGAALDSLADTASLLLGMNDGNGRCDSASRKRSNSPFSFPRQRRSARPRLYLSIDSDTD